MLDDIRKNSKLLISTLPREAGENIGHSFRDKILSCKCKSDKECLYKIPYWKHIRILKFNNCYTFTPHDITEDF